VIQKFLTIIFVLYLAPGCATTAECHLTDDDFEIASQEEIEQWYEQYKGCENDPNVSSDILISLAQLIGWAEIDGYPANRPEHLYDLIYRAAKMGNREALNDLARFYEIGVAELSITRNNEIFGCLNNLANIALEEDSDFSVRVDNCLLLAD